MNALCAICGQRFRSNRSRTYCNRHYWRLRRLAEKPRFELDRLASEADCTKRLIAIVLGNERTDDDVAEVQPGDALGSE